jgi:hypothetical protein
MSSRLSRRGAIADAYQAPASFGIAGFTDTLWTATGTSKTAQSSLTVQAGDMLVAIGTAENETGTLAAPGASGGVTWTSRATNGTASYCRTQAWTAPVTSGGTITPTMAGSSGLAWGFAMWCIRASQYGGVASETNAAEPPSLDITTTAANSILLYLQADWSAADGTSRVWRSVNSVAMSENDYYRNSATYAVYVGNSPNAGAIGVKTVGLSAPSQRLSTIVIEVKP